MERSFNYHVWKLEDGTYQFVSSHEKIVEADMERNNHFCGIVTYYENLHKEYDPVCLGGRTYSSIPGKKITI